MKDKIEYPCKECIKLAMCVSKDILIRILDCDELKIHLRNILIEIDDVEYLDGNIKKWFKPKKLLYNNRKFDICCEFYPTTVHDEVLFYLRDILKDESLLIGSYRLIEYTSNEYSFKHSKIDVFRPDITFEINDYDLISK
jgi:hypothetical protein